MAYEAGSFTVCGCYFFYQPFVKEKNNNGGYNRCHYNCCGLFFVDGKSHFLSVWFEFFAYLITSLRQPKTLGNSTGTYVFSIECKGIKGMFWS